MIKSPARVREAEAAWNRALYTDMDYPEALDRFAALWELALRLNPDIGKEWDEDIKADITLARVLNGLPAST
ncbi:hypothetical protein ACFL6R_03645 [Gemmatimonadota bacterium]